MIDQVAAQDVAVGRPAAVGVEGAHIAGLQGDVVDFVLLEEAIVAGGVDDAARGAVVDQVVRDGHADAIAHRNPLVEADPADVVDVVIDHGAAGVGERGAVAEANQAQPCGADLADIVALQ